MNKEDIIKFQESLTPSGGRRFDWEGKQLKADGDFGPRTEWAWHIAQQDERRQRIVERACRKVGLKELDTNRGPEIDRWLERCGAPLGSAWCASFASWCLSVEAMDEVAIAGAQALGKHFPATFNPKPGDLMWFPTGSWQGHVGIYIGGNIVEAGVVEGNSANMIRVVRRLRRDVCFSCVLPNDITEAPLPLGLPLVQVSNAGTR